MEKMKTQMNAFIDGIYKDLIYMSDAIFDHPETGNQEFFASKLLTDWLKAQGFTVELGLGTLDTAFRAVYEQGEGGPSIGLLAEYDALKGIGHACGHHMQGPCILGAAAAIKNAGIQEPFKLVVYGTPAEEGGRGKREMIEEGFFKDIDLALMMHGSPTTTCDVRSMALREYDVVYKGKAAHAAINPDAGRSALDALLLAFQGVEFMREHVPEDTRMHYTVADTYNIPPNVIPEKARGTFVLRSYNTYVLEDICERFERLLHGAAMMTDTEVEFTPSALHPGKIPVLKLNQLLLDNAAAINAPQLSYEPRKKPGSTDLADVMMLMPGSCIRVAFVPVGTASHSQVFLDYGKAESGHNAVIVGAKVLADSCYELITNPELFHSIQEEYRLKKAEMQKQA